jgi:septal ring factor EnvC (AmiA/AmiB activator)
MTITESGAELAFKILSTLIIPLAVYILNMDSNLTTTRTELISVKQQLGEQKQKADVLYARSEENEKEIREIKVVLSYMKNDLSEIKSDIKTILQQGKKDADK